MLALLSVFLCFLLAGRVLANFNITVGTQQLPVAEILAIPDSPVKSACTANCTAAETSMESCNDDSACLCRVDTVADLLACEQCMYNFLVEKFQRAPDFRAGSQPVLDAYSAECKAANQTLSAGSATQLALAPGWNGLEESAFGTAVAVTLGGWLGFSALYLLSSQ
ncbi:hypothetical protein AX17_006155 [Amanita inopinata Kibby_2008]|nr:hypothetical protein AX17_006155 [Amanita inopinata Kibby_2008]